MHGQTIASIALEGVGSFDGQPGQPPRHPRVGKTRGGQGVIVEHLTIVEGESFQLGMTEPGPPDSPDAPLEGIPEGAAKPHETRVFQSAFRHGRAEGSDGVLAARDAVEKRRIVAFDHREKLTGEFVRSRRLQA